MDLIKRARELRKNQTPAEKKLWKHLKGRQLSKYKFRRQHPVENIYSRFLLLSPKVDYRN